MFRIDLSLKKLRTNYGRHFMRDAVMEFHSEMLQLHMKSYTPEGCGGIGCLINYGSALNLL